MSVSKTTCDLYTVTGAGEHAIIALHYWSSTRHSFGGTLMVHSSYGNFSHTWSTLATPFKEFLHQLPFDTFVNKCLGDAAQVFDGPTTLKNVEQQLSRRRDKGSMNDDQARAIRTNLAEEGATSEAAFYCSMASLSEDIDLQFPGADEFFSAASEYVGKVANPQAVGFWNDL